MEKVPGDDAFLARRREESAGGLGSVVDNTVMVSYFIYIIKK